MAWPVAGYGFTVSKGDCGTLSGALLSTVPSDPMVYRGDSRTPEEKAAAYSRELRRRRGGRRNWHMNGSGATDRP